MKNKKFKSNKTLINPDLVECVGAFKIVVRAANLVQVPFYLKHLKKVGNPYVDNVRAISE